MLTSSRPNRISTKHAVITLTFLAFVTMGLLFPAHQVVQAEDVVLSIFCYTDEIVVRNDSLFDIENYPYILSKGGTPILYPYISIEAGVTSSISLTPHGYGEFGIQIFDSSDKLVKSGTCSRAAPTNTPTPPPTQTPPPPVFEITAAFDGHGSVNFVINNIGPSMQEAYEAVLYESGNKVANAFIWLNNGEGFPVDYVKDPGNYYLEIKNPGGSVVASKALTNVTPTPTHTATSTSTSTSTATSTSTSTKTSTATSTSTSTKTSTATSTPTTTSTPTITSTSAKTSTSTSTLTPIPSDSSNTVNNPGQTPTAKIWFWNKPKKTSTLAFTVTITPTLQSGKIIAAMDATITPTLTQSNVPVVTATPVQTQTQGGIPMSILIVVALSLFGLAGFGLSSFIKKSN